MCSSDLPLEEAVLRNVYFDTCVYHRRGMQLLVDVIPAENILFASEMIGAVRSVDPETGHRFDDTKYLLDSLDTLSDTDRRAVYGGNALRVFGRLEGVLKNLPSSTLSAPPSTPSVSSNTLKEAGN